MLPAKTRIAASGSASLVDSALRMVSQWGMVKPLLLIGKNGEVRDRFDPRTKPEEVVSAIGTARK